MQPSAPNPDPRYHEPKAQALFETGAEVLQGLQTAFDHYQAGKEPGMRR